MTNGNGIVLDDFDGCQPSVCFLVTTLPKVPLSLMRRIKNAIYDDDYVDFGSDEGHCFNVFVDDDGLPTSSVLPGHRLASSASASDDEDQESW